MEDIKQNILLKDFSTMKIGGEAKYFFVLRNNMDLRQVVAFAKEKGLPIFVLGGGSNMLLRDEVFPGLVIKIENKGINIKDYGDHALVEAFAGEGWDRFVDFSIKNKLYGLQNLSYIPGTVGGAPIQNIGAYGVEAGEFIEEVVVFDTVSMEEKKMSKAECKFAYRDSFFKSEEGKKLIILSVVFKLYKEAKVDISYKDLTQYFGENQNPSPEEVREAVISIRKKKFPDLNIYGTAGSFFKNIICDSAFAKKLKESYPELPVFDVGENKAKISTAFVLDKICNLKGFRIGDVGLFENQPLVLVNFGSAKRIDVDNFVKEIKRIVEEKTKIILEEEVMTL